MEPKKDRGGKTIQRNGDGGKDAGVRPSNTEDRVSESEFGLFFHLTNHGFPPKSLPIVKCVTGVKTREICILK